MLTDKQIAAAEKALRDIETEKMVKRIQLRMYRENQARAERWLLPFRMVHRREYIPDEVPPNDFFPLLTNLRRNAHGGPEEIPDAVMITPERARYYFTRILALNIDQLRTYRNSDWTGAPISDDEAQAIKAEYFRRIADYGQHPERYDTEPHMMPEHPEEQYFVIGELL